MKHTAVSGLCQRLDALGAERLAHVLPLFHHADVLEIGLKLVPGGAHRVTAAVAEHRAFATHLTFRHNFASTHEVISLKECFDAIIVPLQMQGQYSRRAHKCPIHKDNARWL